MVKVVLLSMLGGAVLVVLVIAFLIWMWERTGWGLR
jgi:hypothetical protein